MTPVTHIVCYPPGRSTLDNNVWDNYEIALKLIVMLYDRKIDTVDAELARLGAPWRREELPPNTRVAGG